MATNASLAQIIAKTAQVTLMFAPYAKMNLAKVQMKTEQLLHASNAWIIAIYAKKTILDVTNATLASANFQTVILLITDAVLALIQTAHLALITIKYATHAKKVMA